MDNLRVLPLHKHKEYTTDCAELLNSEWPRSKTLRLKSLEASCDLLPTYLVMVYTFHDSGVNLASCNNGLECCKCVSQSDAAALNETNSQPLVNCTSCPSIHKEIVVGHSKISKLLVIQDGCFIESVVIRKEYRGKGWGKLLMEKVELFIKQLRGMKIIFLTTVDKQSFYSKIGYKETEPIPLFGGPVCPNTFDINSALSRLLISSRSSSSSPVVSCSDFTHDCNFFRPVVSEETESTKYIINDDKYTKPKYENNIGPPCVSKIMECIGSSGRESNFYTSSTPTPPPPPPPPMPVFNGFWKQQGNKDSLFNSKKTFMVKLID